MTGPRRNHQRWESPSHGQPSATRDRLAGVKRAELLSSLGAAVLGAGLALQFGRGLVPNAVAILLAGLFAHAGGMFLKHRIEGEASACESCGWRCCIGCAGSFLQR